MGNLRQTGSSRVSMVGGITPETSGYTALSSNRQQFQVRK
jgi:hypothetical protein